MSDIVQKLWGFCHVLRHDGVDYGDYIEQITYLLFIKMADERGVELPKGCAWPQLAATSGVELTTEHFAEFIKCYGSNPDGRAKRDPSQSKDNRWRSFHISEIKQREFKLDSFKWIKDDSIEDADELPEPEELATDAIAELEGAVEELNAVLALLENGNTKV